MPLTRVLKKRVWNFIFKKLDRMTDDRLRGLLVDLAVRRAKGLPPADGLRFLFELEAGLYPVEGVLAVAYGGGVHTKHRHMRYHDFFINRIGSGESVLDIGCGNGALSFDIADRAGAEVLGIDLNENNIAIAKERFSHKSVEYRVGDALVVELPLAADVVVLSNVLEHLPARPHFLTKIRERVNPKRFLIRVPLFEREWRVPLKKELGVEWRLDATHETEYTLESFTAEMVEAGLRIVHQEVRWGEVWAELQINNE